jgi:hypothetical protein
MAIFLLRGLLCSQSPRYVFYFLRIYKNDNILCQQGTLFQMESVPSFREVSAENIIADYIKRHNLSDGKFYYTISLSCKLPIEEYMNDFIVNGCEMFSYFGIQESYNPNKTKQGYLISASPSGKDGTDFISFIKEVYNECCSIINKHKTNLGVRYYDMNHLESKFANPIKYRTESATNEIIPYSRPLMTFKLLHKQSLCDTIFTDLDDNIIPWELLKLARVKFIPVIKFKHLNISGDGIVTLRMEILRAVITNVEVPEMFYKQISIIDKLKELHPNLQNKVSGQLKEIMMLKSKTKSNPYIDEKNHKQPMPCMMDDGFEPLIPSMIHKQPMPCMMSDSFDSLIPSMIHKQPMPCMMSGNFKL